MNLAHLTLERIQITWRHSKSRINYRLISCLDLVDCQMTCHNVMGITIPRSRLRDQDTIIDTQQRVPRHKRKRNLQFKFQRMRIIFFAQTNNHVQLIVDKFCYCYVWPVCIGTEIFTPKFLVWFHSSKITVLNLQNEPPRNQAELISDV